MGGRARHWSFGSFLSPVSHWPRLPHWASLPASRLCYPALWSAWGTARFSTHSKVLPGNPEVVGGVRTPPVPVEVDRDARAAVALATLIVTETEPEPSPPGSLRLWGVLGDKRAARVGTSSGNSVGRGRQMWRSTWSGSNMHPINRY